MSHISFFITLMGISSFILFNVVECSNEKHRQFKRQIFREQVLPHTGGKIPEDAFRSDRLALNRLNKEGITVPDGVLLATRHRESHHSSHRADPDIDGSIIKLILKPDGRYAPPEGNYPFGNLIDSTYIIRPPTSAKHYLRFPPYKPIEAPLQIPAEPFFPSDDDILSLTNHIENFYNLNHLEESRIWPNFGPMFHGRILRAAVPNINHSPKGVSNSQNQAQASVKLATAINQLPTLKPSSIQKRPSDPAQQNSPHLINIPYTSFKCTPTSPRLSADPETGCQVFHLCHMDGQKESFLCPKGMRYNAVKSQCIHWEQVPCHVR
ncbi:uncharacterized protein LOC142327612 [Lycorma delicatula]|uniref:uncharacterized protein LOC142327612 n=1 Tax=Lycorma delicatula TaxID=130591 RepID=UPI003F51649E